MMVIEFSVTPTTATVTVADALTVPELAVMVAVPPFPAVTRPVVLTAPTEGVSELQVADEVTSAVLPSLYVPMAVNCCVPPGASATFCGVIEIETSCGLLTVRVVEAVTDPEVAVIVVVPPAALVTKPALPALLLMTATLVVLEFQVTLPVMSWGVLSL